MRAALTERVEAWNAAAALAAGLEELRANPPSDRDGQSWRDTQVREDTDVLLCVVRDVASPSADEPAKLAERLRRQLGFHEEYVHAWERRARLDDLQFSANEKNAVASLWARADLDKFNERVAALGEAIAPTISRPRWTSGSLTSSTPLTGSSNPVSRTYRWNR